MHTAAEQCPPSYLTPEEAVSGHLAKQAERLRRPSLEGDRLSIITEPALLTGDTSPGSKTPEEALEDHRRSRTVRRSLSLDQLPKVRKALGLYSDSAMAFAAAAAAASHAH